MRGQILWGTTRPAARVAGLLVVLAIATGTAAAVGPAASPGVKPEDRLPDES